MSFLQKLHHVLLVFSCSVCDHFVRFSSVENKYVQQIWGHRVQNYVSILILVSHIFYLFIFFSLFFCLDVLPLVTKLNSTCHHISDALIHGKATSHMAAKEDSQSMIFNFFKKNCVVLILTLQMHHAEFSVSKFS